MPNIPHNHNFIGVKIYQYNRLDEHFMASLNLFVEQTRYLQVSWNQQYIKKTDLFPGWEWI